MLTLNIVNLHRLLRIIRTTTVKHAIISLPNLKQYVNVSTSSNEWFCVRSKNKPKKDSNCKYPIFKRVHKLKYRDGKMKWPVVYEVQMEILTIRNIVYVYSLYYVSAY